MKRQCTWPYVFWSYYSVVTNLYSSVHSAFLCLFENNALVGKWFNFLKSISVVSDLSDRVIIVIEMLVVSETLWWFPWSLLAVELESGRSDAQAWLGRRRVEPTYKIAALRPLKYVFNWIQKIHNTSKDATNVYKGMFVAPDKIPSRLLNLQFAAVLWM